MHPSPTLPFQQSNNTTPSNVASQAGGTVNNTSLSRKTGRNDPVRDRFDHTIREFSAAFAKSFVPKIVISEECNHAAEAETPTGVETGRADVALGGVEALHPRKDPGEAAQAGERDLAVVVSAQGLTLHAHTPGQPWVTARHGHVITSPVEAFRRYDMDAADFAYMCQDAGIPTGIPIAGEVLALANQAAGIRTSNQADLAVKRGILSSAAALAASTVVVSA